MVDVTVVGELGFSTPEVVDALWSEVDDLDVAVAELFDEGITREGTALCFDVTVGLPSEANLDLQGWLEDAAEQAIEGSLEVAQDDERVRMDAGGGETPL